MKSILVCRIFLASPGDTAKERKIIQRACDEWNRDNSAKQRIRLEVITWQKDLATTSGISAQAAINYQLLQEADIVIGVFKSSFGSATENFDSGTQEEIERALAAKKPVILYFMKFHATASTIDTNGITQIQAFRDKYQSANVYKQIESDTDLSKAVRKDIDFNVELLLSPHAPESMELDKQRIEDKATYEQIQSSEAWYEQSISSLIRSYLDANHFAGIRYLRGITWAENLTLNKESEVPSESIRDALKKAREYAFSTKYGAYDYSADLRSLSPSWWKPVEEELMRDEFRDILGVGSNTGQELTEIFGRSSRQRLMVLDLSSEAISRGLDQNKHIIFHQGNMEEIPFSKNSFDLYLNFRSIHSSGVELKLAIAEAARVLRPGGTCIISVSDGYLEIDIISGRKKVCRGMFDTRNDLFIRGKPYKLANKIREKMEDYQFEDIRLMTGPAELFVTGRLPKQEVN